MSLFASTGGIPAVMAESAAAPAQSRQDVLRVTAEPGMISTASDGGSELITYRSIDPLPANLGRKGNRAAVGMP